MSSFCTAKATHIFSAKKFQHICVSLDVNFNESLTNDVVSFEQLGPEDQGPVSHQYLFVLKNETYGYLMSYSILTSLKIDPQVIIL